MNVFIINMKLVPYSFNLISYLDFFFFYRSKHLKDLFIVITAFVVC